MKYKIKKAELIFDTEGKLKRIRTTASMPYNPGDIRKIEANRDNIYWTQFFTSLDPILQEILQKTTAEGGEI